MPTRNPGALGTNVIHEKEEGKGLPYRAPFRPGALVFSLCLHRLTTRPAYFDVLVMTRDEFREKKRPFYDSISQTSKVPEDGFKTLVFGYFELFVISRCCKKATSYSENRNLAGRLLVEQGDIDYMVSRIAVCGLNLTNHTLQSVRLEREIK